MEGFFIMTSTKVEKRWGVCDKDRENREVGGGREREGERERERGGGREGNKLKKEMRGRHFPRRLV